MDMADMMELDGMGTDTDKITEGPEDAARRADAIETAVHRAVVGTREVERVEHGAMKQRSEGASKMAERAMQSSPDPAADVDAFLELGKDAPSLESRTEPQPEIAGRLQLSLGSVVDIQGLRLQLSYINTGKGRLTFVVLNEEALVIEAPRDPIVGVG